MINVNGSHKTPDIPITPPNLKTKMDDEAIKTIVTLHRCPGVMDIPKYIETGKTFRCCRKLDYKQFTDV